MIFTDRWDAQPTRACPHPIILIHGTTATNQDFASLGQSLREQGFTVFAPNYGNRATEPLSQSIRNLHAYSAAVQHATGAEKLIFIGHSQGGIHAHLLAHVLTTHQVITLSAPLAGTVPGGALTQLFPRIAPESYLPAIKSIFGPAGGDQLTGSDFLSLVPDSPADGVPYTCIATRNEETVTPVESCFLPGAENLFVQDRYPNHVVLHSFMPTDRKVHRLIFKTLSLR